MKSKEEPPLGSTRGNPSSLEETTGSLSRPGSTVTARVEQPALAFHGEGVAAFLDDAGAFAVILADDDQ